MDLDIRSIIRSQHHAALDMLGAAIEACPEAVWDRPEDVNRSWLLAYHALFFVHLYLQPTEADFVPWEKHQEHYDAMGQQPWPPPGQPELAEPLPKAEILEYLALCRDEVDRQTMAVDLHAESGFHWLPMSKLELQLYSMRHTMQHAGELYERIAKTSGAELPWVGLGRREG